ncbi:MAG: hypothetical protein CMH27_11470 [Micavibrio sp.]|nr:hypothetical protein [Micavibrio sp.]
MPGRIVQLFTSLILILLLLVSAAYAQGPSAFFDPGAQQSGGGSPGGGLVPVEPNVDGGAVPIGATAQVVVRFRNDGATPVQTTSIRLYPSSTVSATISLDQCQEAALSPGAECAIALSVKGLQAGAWRVEMLVSHTGRTRLVSSTLTGTVEASGEGTEKLSSDVEAIPDEVDFESLTASQTLVEPVILRNITSIPINISDIYIDASDNAGFSLKTECESLQPGQACIATVRWSPKLRGPVSGVLVVKHDGPTALSSVPLKGAYDPETVNQAETFPEAVPGKGLLVASQTEIDFGNEIEKASTITVSLVNAGDSDLTLRTIDVAGKDNGLTIRGTGCQPGQVLEPIEACPLTVSWSPTYVGTLLDDIQIVHDGARGVLVLPVRGEAEGVVSQDQGAIMLSNVSAGPAVIGRQDITDLETEEDVEAALDIPAPQKPASAQSGGQARGFVPQVSNPASVLDGLKITSFSPTRAIVAGPGGSRIVFDNEAVVLGGIEWDVHIQRNGIEFTSQGQTVLLLFDRSLSSVNRVNSQSSNASSSSSGSDSDSGDGGDD